MDKPTKIQTLQNITDTDVEAYLDKLEFYNSSMPSGHLLTSTERNLLRGLINRWKNYANNQYDS